MRRLSSLWGIGAMLVVSLTMALVDAQGCTGNDANGCEIFKYTSCGGDDTIVDVGFVLDRSGSMEWGIRCSTCNGVSCPVTLDPGIGTANGCQRSDIMRVVLRKVMKRIFQKFSQDCYEYLESEQFLNTGRPCQDTRLRMTLLWWSSQFNRADKFLEFSKKGNDQWSKNLANFLYLDRNTYPRNPDRWERINGQWKIKASAIDTYFDEIIYAGYGNFPKYPNGGGGTLPTKGVNEWKKIITEEEKKPGTRKYPTFLMTDGKVNGDTGGTEYNDMLPKSNELRASAANVETYGLGLTGDSGLKIAQTLLYDFSKWVTTSSVKGVDQDHFFSTQASADIVVDAILGRVTKGCKTCYSLQGYPDSCKTPPVFPGFNDPDTNPQEVRTVATTQEVSEVSQRTSDLAEFVKFEGDDRVYKIKQGVILCESYEPQYPDLKFVEFDSDGTCVCCKKLNAQPGDCLCDYTSTTPLFTTKEFVGKDKVERIVEQYSGDSRLAAQIRANPEQFTSEDTTNNDDAGDQGTGGGDPNGGGIDGDGGDGGGGGVIIDPTTGLPKTNTTIPDSGVNVAVSLSALLATAGCWALM